MTRRKRTEARKDQSASPYVTWEAAHAVWDKLSSRVLRIEIYIGAQVLAIGWWVTGKPSPQKVPEAVTHLLQGLA